MVRRRVSMSIRWVGNALRDSPLGKSSSIRSVYRLADRLLTPTGEVWVDQENWALKVDTGEFIGRKIYRHGEQEPAVAAYLNSAVEPGDTVVDLGAHIGYHTNRFCHLAAPAGRVVAVEPVPSNVSLLRESIERNGFDNVSVLNVAVGASHGTAQLALDERNSGMATILPGRSERAHDTIEVEQMALDTILDQHGIDTIDLLKVDIEGAEFETLGSFSNQFDRVQSMVIDTHVEMVGRDVSGGLFDQLDSSGDLLSLDGKEPILRDEFIERNRTLIWR